MPTTKADIIAQLQKDILLLSGNKPPVTDMALPNGLPFMRPHFPQGVFPLGAVHEFLCSQPEDTAATGGFISGVLSTCMPLKGAVIWISLRKGIFPPALNEFNIEPNNIIFIHPANEKEILWVTEEALKCDSLTAVVAEMQDLNFTNSRRFQLAVEHSKVTGFVLNQKPISTVTNACLSRWQINSLPSIPENGLPGVGHPRWKVELKKIRNGKPGSWQIEWMGDTFRQVQPVVIPILKEAIQKQTG
jgi:protein ImuA